MTPMKYVAIILAISCLATALNAARWWWKASKTPIESMPQSPSDVPEIHILSTQVAFYESSKLNSRAALWTGISAVLSAAASVCGVL